MTNSHALKDGDSLYRGSLSGTAQQDVLGCVHVTIMRRAAATRPTALIQSRTPFRAGDYAACVAGLGTPTLVHFLERRAMPNGLVRELRPEGRPACVKDAFRHAGFGELRGRDVTDRDVIKLLHQSVRQLVQEVPARIGDTRMDVGRLSLLAGALSLAEFFFKRAEVARVFDLFACGKSCELLQSKVDADASTHWALLWLLDFDADVQKPVAARVSGKIGSVLDLRAGRQVTALEHLEFSTVEVEALSRLLDVATLQGHPAERFLATVAKEGALLLRAGLGVLLAHRIDRPSVQAEFLAATRCELVQIEASGPTLAPLKRVLLRVVCEIPDDVYRPSLLVQQPVQGFDAVAVNEDHFCRFRYSASARRTCSDTDRSVFCASSRRAAKSGSGRKKFARIMRTLYTQNTYDTYGAALYLPGLKSGVSREF